MLKFYSESGNLTAACAYAKIARQSHYNWLETDPQYAQRFQLAADAACDALVSEARRRAFTGVVEPTGWYKSIATTTIRRYSDNLLMFLIKGDRPEKYREKYEVTGAGGQPIQVLVANYAAPDPGKKPEPKTVPAIEGTATDV